MEQIKVVTGKVRFLYVSAFRPRAWGAERTPRYSVCLLIDKKDEETVERIRQACAAALGDEGLSEPWIDPLRDGDREKPDGSRYGRACRGCYVLSASSPFAPGVVDRALSPIRSPGDLYPGCYGRASLYFRRAGGVRGVAVELGNLQKLEDGERLDRAGLAADDFDDGYARDGTRC